MAEADARDEDDETPDAPAAPAPGQPLELDSASMRAYVLGSLDWRGSAHEDLAARAHRALGWMRALAVRGLAQGVPFVWVYDLGHLLTEGDTFRFRSALDLGALDDEARALRLEYENRLLNGLLRDPSCRRAIEAVRQDASRDDLIARAIELLLAPLRKAGGHERAPVGDPVLLRELAVHGALDPAVEAAAYDERAGAGAMRDALRSSLRRYFAHRPPGPALGPDDLAEIEHWSAYKRAAQRLAGRRIAARAADFPRIDPRQVQVSEAQEVDTEQPDSGYYPSGGFSELATRGSIENLVPSELVYMGEDPWGMDKDPPIDLFALRTFESETLYFQRDSGQLRRTRRTVHVAIAPGQGLRVQLRWHNDPMSVLVYGLVVRLIEDLGAVFQADALRTEVHLVHDERAADATPGERDRLQEDAELLRVLLRHEIARGAAAVHVAKPDLDLRALGERARRVYGIAVAAGDRPPAGLPAGPPPRLVDGVRPPRLVVWRLGGAAPEDSPAALPVVHTTVEGSPVEPLAHARRALLDLIAGLGRTAAGGRRPRPGAPSLAAARARSSG